MDGSQRLKPDVSAPGFAVRSSIPGGGYGYMDGTSMAAPHVAGLIALLWSEADFIQRRLPQVVSELDAVLPAITVSVVCLIVVSLLTSNNKMSEE